MVTRGVALVAVVSAAWSVLTVTTDRTDGTETPTNWYSGQAIGAVAEADDTILVLYGRADIVLASGLRPAYPQLWSLPMRVLDPDLDQMRTLLAGAGAPTWIVQGGDLNAWGLDSQGKLSSILTDRYRIVGTGCEQAIWLLESAQRPAISPVDCGRPWPQLL
jgi:hypothetical protein